MRSAVLVAAIFGLLFSFIWPWFDAVASAPDEFTVDLQLVLAVDASSSMDPYEQRLQRDGYVTAFRSPAVLQAILAGLHGRIAVTYVEWGDPRTQTVVVPWRMIDGLESSERFASELALAPVNRYFGTSIAGALAFSSELFPASGFNGGRWVIDISGDGPNNLGPSVGPARDEVLTRGITINGLPVMLRLRWGGGLYNISGLDTYYRDCVIGGPNAFVVAARSRDNFAEAIEQKLVMEIMAGGPARVMPMSLRQVAFGVDCSDGGSSSGGLPSGD